MLFMVIERFRDGDPLPVYRRFRDFGRMAPEGVRYVASWVTADLARCYQVMECARPELLHDWMAAWRDIVDFQIEPVVTSADAAALVYPRLETGERAE